jgi:SET domain-containing protein
MAKVIVKQSSINGMGVFASESIAKGELLLAIDDSRIVTPEFPLDESKGDEYH